CLKRCSAGDTIRAKLKHDLRQRGANKKKPRLVSVNCFGICPKKAVVLASGRSLQDNEYLLVSRPRQVEPALDKLLPTTWTPAFSDRDHRSTRLSVAFTKEESAETAAETLLPDRPISPHPNLVTGSGLKLLERQFQEARSAYEAAQTTEDVNERRRP